jgi:hypothetical protein
VTEENKKLHFIKDISHKEGYKYFIGKMKSDFPEIDLSLKNYLVFFWDSLKYSHRGLTMKILDSIASNLHVYNCEYVFATEMNETAAKEFLKRKGAEFKKFRVIGGMDDFISGVYNENPIQWEISGPKLDSAKLISSRLYTSKIKVKGYYFLMNSKGDILYHTSSYWLPNKDTALLRVLSSFTHPKSLKNLD